MSVSPVEAIQYLCAAIDHLALTAFASPNGYAMLQNAFTQGWNASREHWRPACSKPETKFRASRAYQKKKGGGSPGVLTGTTKNLMTLQEGTYFRVTPDGISLFGQDLPSDVLERRRKFGGGIDFRPNPPYRTGLGSCSPNGKSFDAHGRANKKPKGKHSYMKSTGRTQSVDNRVTPPWKFGRYLAPALNAPIDMPQDGDFKSAMAQWAVPPDDLHLSHDGKLWYKVQGGKAVRTSPLQTAKKRRG